MSKLFLALLYCFFDFCISSPTKCWSSSASSGGLSSVTLSGISSSCFNLSGKDGYSLILFRIIYKDSCLFFVWYWDVKIIKPCITNSFASFKYLHSTRRENRNMQNSLISFFCFNCLHSSNFKRLVLFPLIICE